ncbi:MAG TPA: hypothetical protein VFQ45_07610 [Longimicrobium sp.]|nr:hypothetical protein [Longimicrobium sp.]
MTDATGHLPYWTLEQLAEGALSHRESRFAEQHLRSCAHCSAELASARALVAALEGLPALAPSPRFAEGVMARVQLAHAAAPAAAAVRSRRWLPRTRAGWTRLLVLVLAPVLPLLGVSAWMGANPLAGMGALWTGVRGWARDVAWNLMAEGTETLIRTGLFQWGSDVLAGIPGPTVAGLPALLLLVVAAVPVSAWAMTRLLRGPAAGGMLHA